MMRPLAIAAIIVLVVAWPAPLRAQQIDLRSLPSVTRQYEQRLEAVRSGTPPPIFHGSASIMPARAQESIASIGIAGLPRQQGHFCGAALIDPHWALTAAHCVTEPTRPAGEPKPAAIDPTKLQVLVGTNNLLAGGAIKPISRIVLHPDFHTTADGIPINDLALLQFADAVTARPFPIASEALERIAIRPGDRVGIAGWGTSSFTAESPISADLLLAVVPVVDRVACNEAYRGAVTAEMFCAGLGVADACQGDSGGPAWVYDQRGVPSLIGIVSWGAGCTRARFPGVYVNVVKYRGWIDATIGRQQAVQ